MVVTISPSFSLYSIVVLPAASKPTANNRMTQSMLATEPIQQNKRSP